MTRSGQTASRAIVTVALADLWRERGWDDRNCRDADPDSFFKRDGEHWSVARKRLMVTAEFFCRSCPIRRACREAGRDDAWGMWGGVAHKRDTRGVKVGEFDLLAGERQRAG